MGINKVHEWEQAIVTLLNIDGWDLEWCGGGFKHYDAKGKTPKGKNCVLEIKVRKKWYVNKMIEKYKLDKLISEDCVALYFVADPKGNYLYWLNDIELPKVVDMYCPDTTLWTKKKVLKPCYLLPEEQAHRVNSYAN
jgi:hypothetical protein|tara:strand:+ start:9127 stop:9537 length:411 start_codon:yes stop_codon:yes gene_type:complete